MNNEVLDSLTQVFAERRLGHIARNDLDYVKSVEEEERLYNLLCHDLDDAQKEILDSYMHAFNATASHIERLSYQQGMKDLFHLFHLLGNG